MKYPDDFIDQVILGDCLEVMKDIPDKSIDLILTDPPYNITACEWDKAIDLSKMWEQLERIGKDDCIYLFTSIQPFTTDLINSKRNWFKYDWVWNKVNGSNFMNLKYEPFRIHESVLVFAKGTIKTFNPQRESRTLLSLKRYPAGKEATVHCGGVVEHYAAKGTTSHIDDTGLKHPTSIVTISKAGDNNEYDRFNSGFTHPTSKPLALMRYFILTYSNEGDLILDPFLGSGTTAVAAKKLGRHYIGIEIEPKYVEIAKKRLNFEMLNFAGGEP